MGLCHVVATFIVGALVFRFRSPDRTGPANYWNIGSRSRSTSADKPLIDVILFDSELDMLHYRMKLHEDFVKEFVIVESDMTFSGKPKRLLAQENFTESIGGRP